MKYIAVILALGFLASCSELEYEDELPDITGMQAATMQTELPIIEITADPATFNYMFSNFEEKIIIEGQVHMLSATKDTLMKKRHVLMELRGASSVRSAMKSIGFIFSEDVPNDSLGILQPAKVLEGDHLDNFKALRIRNSGNDFGRSMIKDLAYTEYAIFYDLDFELMYGRPVHAFVNGEYYGLLNLRTESNREGLARLNQVEVEDITLLEVDVDNGNLEFDGGDLSLSNRLTDAIEAEDPVAMAELIDADNFIDYLIFQDYIGNRDWPENNVRVYSVNGQPFRFFLFDLDYVAYNAKNAKLPELEYRSYDVAKIYRLMIQTTGFEDKLWKRQKELYQLFSAGPFFDIVDNRARIIEDEILYLIAKYYQPQNTMAWRMEIDEIKHEFNKRDHYIRNTYGL